MLCKECISSNLDPNVVIDRNGICNFCKFYDQHKNKLLDFKSLKWKFEKRISKVKAMISPSGYNCIIPYSGGKDSTYILQYMHKNYGLKILAVICDNYFIHPDKLINAIEILKRLNIEYTHIKISENTVKKFFGALFSNTGSICAGCMGFIWTNVLRVAVDEKIPSVIIGESRDQIFRGGYYHSLGIVRPDDFEKLLHIDEQGFYWKYYYVPTFKLAREKLKLFKCNDKEIKREVALKHRHIVKESIPDIIPFFFYHPHNELKIIEELKKNVGWKVPLAASLMSHPDCLFHATCYPDDQNTIGHYIKENVVTRKKSLEEVSTKISDWIDINDTAKLEEVCYRLGLKLEDIKYKHWYKYRQDLRERLRKIRDQHFAKGQFFIQKTPEKAILTQTFEIKGKPLFLCLIEKIRSFVIRHKTLRGVLKKHLLKHAWIADKINYSRQETKYKELLRYIEREKTKKSLNKKR
ncbi:MAG: hypothetical protein PHU64_02045 [Candidatus Omnitrophica bacterium]|nr:hypothetical protein [Candidatus Omnitrophota bacterium]MDD5429601.1 hypothetical protein [Candidatus Omnitrophota bacterium]